MFLLFSGNRISQNNLIKNYCIYTLKTVRIILPGLDVQFARHTAVEHDRIGVGMVLLETSCQ